MKPLFALDRELQTQPFSSDCDGDGEVASCRRIAAGYAQVEQAIAVLSDMASGVSYIYYGATAECLGIASRNVTEVVSSIWEQTILERVHVDDLQEKYLQELRFFHFVKHLPPAQRADYGLVNLLRMRDADGLWHSVLHRLFYLSAGGGRTLRMALCLYTICPEGFMAANRVVELSTGRVVEVAQGAGRTILSEREQRVLRMIDGGLSSKEIAEACMISVHTVSRHRQNILQKLRVKNSIEACRAAKALHIL